jgi:hypothetical protein
MDYFKQNKMTKNEWQGIEKSVDDKEKKILELIKEGYTNPTASFSIHNTLGDIIKLNHNESDYYVYDTFIKPYIASNYKKYIKYDIGDIKIKQKLSKKDKIRLDNQTIDISNSIEIILIGYLKKFIKSNKLICYYNINFLVNHFTLNKYVLQMVSQYIKDYVFKPRDLLKHGYDILENNEIFNYNKVKLYEHQKQLYSIYKQQQSPSLVFYVAPTSCGKTLTPIGLCEEYKVIFICASRHIAVNLAKSCVNIGRKVGFAFGCNSVDDVRLHYFSVSKYTSTKYPIHSEGGKVEMLLCDLSSYEIAMKYMLTFFEKQKIILFWDEPTISMDHEEHPLHSIIKHNWNVNQIPNIVMSSATLPANLSQVIDSYKNKFNGEYHKIETSDEHSNITLVDKEGGIIMPHKRITKENIPAFISSIGCKYIKFLSIRECCDYILSSGVEFNLPMNDITPLAIKQLYYELIQTYPLQSPTNNKVFDNSLSFTSKDASNIVHGPALWITDDLSHMETLISDANIPSGILNHLESHVEYNAKVCKKIEQLSKNLEDKMSKMEDKMIENQRFDASTKEIQKNIGILEKQFKEVQLNNMFIPNTNVHYKKWTQLDDFKTSNVFSSSIDDSYIKKIIDLDIEVNYKILLMMGIGILNKSNETYNNVMKELADNKNLFMILASSDYIYGTNYQFAQCYLADNMTHLTQEKIIQAIGRVGRKEKNKTFTFRFLNNEHIDMLFQNNNHMEETNMNKLYS